MGYLAVLSGVFIIGLIINAMALALLSQWMFHEVQSWVLIASLVIAALGASLVADRYDGAHNRQP